MVPVASNKSSVAGVLAWKRRSNVEKGEASC